MSWAPTSSERWTSARRSATLTVREQQVLELLARGMRNKEIASALGITADTTGAHVKSIYAKFGVHDRTAALAEAIRRGLIYIK